MNVFELYVSFYKKVNTKHSKTAEKFHTVRQNVQTLSVYHRGCISSSFLLSSMCYWCRTQVVRDRSAKPPCIGSNPIGTSCEKVLLKTVGPSSLYARQQKSSGVYLTIQGMEKIFVLHDNPPPVSQHHTLFLQLRDDPSQVASGTPQEL